MKKYLFAGVFLFVLNVAALSQAKPSEKSGESTGWSSWIIHKPENSKLPSILLIGDSHVQRYFPVVTKDLEGKMIVSKITSSISKRNELVEKFCKRKHIPVLDFSSLSINHENYYVNDGIHFNPEGVNAQAQMITDMALKLMASSGN